MTTSNASVVAYAKSLVGKTYRWGGSGIDPFDCTGLVRATAPTLGLTDIETAEALMPNGDRFEPSLVTVPNVELIEVGEDWETSTGIFTFSEADLVAAIESQADPAVRAPVVKLGHVDKRFDGQPSLGRIENLSLSNNNQTLCGDLVGVPQWLAAVMYSAYPRRSIEGNFATATRTGNLWDFTLSGVALLGDAYPAINTLDDIKALWGSETPTLYPVEDVEEIAASGNFIRARRLTEVKWKKRNNEEAAPAVAASATVEASASVDDVRSAFYDSLGPTQMWWWVRTVLVNPLQLVVDDDLGNLWLIDVSTDSDDNITFGEPTSVKVEYVAASGSPLIAPRSAGQLIAASYVTSADSGGKVHAPSEDSEAPTEGKRTVLTDAALVSLGLQPGATEEEISTAVLSFAQANSGDGGTGETPAAEVTTTTQPETPATDPVATPTPAGATTTDGIVIPDGMLLVDQTAWQAVQDGVAASSADLNRRAVAERDSFIAAGAQEGKYGRSRVAHFTTLWDADPEGTRDLITKLSPGIVPVDQRTLAGETDPVAASQAEYPASWKPVVATAGRKVNSRIKVMGD